MKKCHIVADGSGARGLYAFAGAIEEIQKQYEIKNFAGVSAGAVVGALVKTGQNLKVIWGGDRYPYCVAENEFPEDLQIFISNLQTGQSEVYDHNGNLSLFKAVKQSVNIPCLFFDGNNQYCDGTMTSNFPYIAGLNTFGVLKKETNIPTFGLFLYLDESVSSYLYNSNLNHPSMRDFVLTYFNYIDAQRIYKEHLPSTVRKIIYIPVMDILATNFDLTDKQKEQLYNNGRKAARKFFKEYGNS